MSSTINSYISGSYTLGAGPGVLTITTSGTVVPPARTVKGPAAPGITLSSGSSWQIQNAGLVKGGMALAGYRFYGGAGIYAYGANVQLSGAGTVAGGDGNSFSQNGLTGGAGIKLLAQGSIQIGGAGIGTPQVFGGNGGVALLGGYGGAAVSLDGASILNSFTQTLDNGGTLRGGNGGIPTGTNGGSGGSGGPGVYVGGLYSSNAVVNNTGLIQGGSGALASTYGGSGGYGIRSNGSSVTITNQSGGQVFGGTGGAASAAYQSPTYYIGAGSGGIGIFEATRSAITQTVFNYGTITGGAGGNESSSGMGGRGGDGIETQSMIYAQNNGGRIAGGAGGSSANGAGGTGGLGAYISSGTYGGGLSNSQTGFIIGGNGGAGGTLSGAGGAGVYKYGNGTFTNAGTIMGGDGAARTGGQAGHGGDGVHLSGASSTVPFINHGLVQGGNAGSFVTGTGSVALGGTGVLLKSNSQGYHTGTIINYGTIAGGLDGQGNRADAVLLSSGALGHLYVAAGASFVGNVVAQNSADTLGLLASGTGTLGGIGSSITGFGTITFETGASWTLEGSLAGLDSAAINGFIQGDTIVLDHFTETGVSFTTGTGLVLSSSGGSYTLHTTGAMTTSNYSVVQNGANTVIFLCYYPGTRIATPAGEVAVEDLQPGSMVQTSNGPKRVRWVGQSQVSTRFADPLRALPIRIRAGVLGAGLPQRDLLVSPDHALFMEGVLVQANALVNGVGIVREHNVPECFTYYHVELETHELLLAEGVWAESFVDNVERWHFSNWDKRCAPDQMISEMPYPRVKSSRQLPGSLRAKFTAAA